MNHVHYSSEDRHAHLAQTGAAFLAQERQHLNDTPDPLRKSILPCPDCGLPLNMRLGRHSGLWFITHQMTRHCIHGGDLTRIEAPDRDAAMKRFLENAEATIGAE